MSDELEPWEVLDSRDLLDASPYLKVRAETVQLPDGRQVVVSVPEGLQPGGDFIALIPGVATQ